MAVLMRFCFVLMVGMLFGSLTAKPLKDPAPLNHHYDGESNEYFDVGELFPVLVWKEVTLILKKECLEM